MLYSSYFVEKAFFYLYTDVLTQLLFFNFDNFQAKVFAISLTRRNFTSTQILG